MATKTPAERIKRYQEGYGDGRWYDPATHSQARDAALSATITNALDCIETQEAANWLQLGQLLSFRYRKLST